MLSNYGLAEKIIACQAISAGQVLIEECSTQMANCRSATRRYLINDHDIKYAGAVQGSFAELNYASCVPPPP